MNMLLVVIVVLVTLFGCSSKYEIPTRIYHSQYIDYKWVTLDSLKYKRVNIGIGFDKEVYFSMSKLRLTNLHFLYPTDTIEATAKVCMGVMFEASVTHLGNPISIEVPANAFLDYAGVGNEAAYHEVPTIPVQIRSGDITYESMIGESLWFNGNLAALIAEPTLYFSDAIEKWKFYRDSIIAFTTVYDHNTKQAIDKFKWKADVVRMDNEWYDWEDMGWRTTETVWKAYRGSPITGNWTDVCSFTSPVVNLCIQHGKVKDDNNPNDIYVGSYETLSTYLSVAEPTEVWYLSK